MSSHHHSDAIHEIARQFLDDVEYSHLLDPAELREMRLKEARALSLLAFLNGWSYQKVKNVPVVILSAGDGSEASFRISMNDSINFKTFRAHVNTISRHRGYRGTDPDMKTFVSLPPVVMLDIIVSTVKLDPDHLNIIRKAFEEQPKEEEVPQVSITSDLPPGPVGRVAPILKEAPKIVTLVPERHLLKEEPWIAHSKSRASGGTETYPSDAVMERQWSDTTTDFACRFPDCDYVEAKPHSVARHYAAKHSRGKGRTPQPEIDGVDMEWTPSQGARIKRLKRELDGALTAALAEKHDIHDTEWIAEWIITHRIEGVGGGDGGGAEEGPLTAEQIIDKIAALVVRGRSPILREQIETLNAMLDKSEANRKRDQADMKAMADLFAETMARRLEEPKSE